MFEHLFDPEPPTATSTHLAEVRRRAAQIRNRRRATRGALSAALVSGALVGGLQLGAILKTDEVVQTGPSTAQTDPTALGTSGSRFFGDPLFSSQPAPFEAAVATALPMTVAVDEAGMLSTRSSLRGGSGSGGVGMEWDNPAPLLLGATATSYEDPTRWIQGVVAANVSTVRLSDGNETTTMPIEGSDGLAAFAFEVPTTSVSGVSFVIEGLDREGNVVFRTGPAAGHP